MSTSVLIAPRASSGEISPSNSTDIAPNVITCQICSLKDPTCLRAVSTKTLRRISTGRSGKGTRKDIKDVIDSAIELISLVR
jgi:hypothetical protein